MHVRTSSWHYRLWRRAYVDDPSWLHVPVSWCGLFEFQAVRDGEQARQRDLIAEAARERLDRFMRGRYSLCPYFWSVVLALTVYAPIILPFRWVTRVLRSYGSSLLRMGTAVAIIALCSGAALTLWWYSVREAHRTIATYERMNRQWQPRLGNFDPDMGDLTHDLQWRLGQEDPWTSEIEVPWWGWRQEEITALSLRVRQRQLDHDGEWCWTHYLEYGISVLDGEEGPLACFRALSGSMFPASGSEVEPPTERPASTAGGEFGLFDLSWNDFRSAHDALWYQWEYAPLWLAVLPLSVAVVYFGVFVQRFYRRHAWCRAAWGGFQVIYRDTRELFTEYLRAVKQRACPFLVPVKNGSNGVN